MDSCSCQPCEQPIDIRHDQWSKFKSPNAFKPIGRRNDQILHEFRTDIKLNGFGALSQTPMPISNGIRSSRIQASLADTKVLIGVKGTGYLAISSSLDHLTVTIMTPLLVSFRL